MYNKFKNTEFKDVNNLGYAIKSTGNIINNGTLTQNSTTNINSDLNVTGFPFFVGGNNQSLPTTSSGNLGLGIYWNTVGGLGESDFLNYSQGGVGGFAFYNISSTTTPKLLAQIDNNGSSSCSCSSNSNCESCSCDCSD